MIALAIDSSTYRGTVAVIRDSKVVSRREAAMRGQHSEELLPAVVQAMSSAGVGVQDLDRVICGGGPGSFTSLRIGASIAKGIALGAGLPLYAVSSLGLTLASSPAAAGRYLVTLDALRDEWYVAVFSRLNDGSVVEEQPVIRVARQDLEGLAATHAAEIVGSAATADQPHAADCVAMMASLDAAGPVDIERWEPSYGRLAEAQVKWEAAHGRPLGA